MRVAMCLFLAASAARGADYAQVFNVKMFGAAGDKKTLDTLAIQKTIDACHKSGGGVVYFPTGDFLSGTLTLTSGVTLHLSPGATLWGSRNIGDYNPRHLLYARDAENIAIEGGGAINGQGEAFWDQDFKPLARPSPLIELWGCRDVRIQDVRILNAPAWTIHPKNCVRVKIRGISLVNNMKGLNTDGIDPDSSRDVIISDSYIEAGDDCIVLKTTSRGGPVLPCENVTVTNCVLVSSASALKLGTESHADFRHIVFSNCVIRNSRTGIALLNKDGATMEGIHFSNITMQTAPKVGKGVEWPIVIDLEKRAPESRLGRIRDVTLSDIRIYTKGRIMVTGMPESPFERITFRNVTMRVDGWEAVEKERKLRGGTVRKVPGVIDLGSVPAALILAHIRNLDLDGFHVDWDAPAPAPERHVLWGENLDSVRITGFDGRPSRPGGKLAAIQLKDARNVTLNGGSWPPARTRP
ncbi:MAG: glycoside hydrolase family 28 protein [Acidobacteria bacterium]|nr:glycoside hydrolase family 28 protein [Acidobacteriota bacterium]